MTSEQRNTLERAAAQIRRAVLTQTHAAKSGHPGGSLSIADLMAYLYFAEMRIDPKNPAWEDRDRLVLSKGHTAPALYAALALRGFFPQEELTNLRQVDSFLQGHPDMKKTPGVDMSSGSLGLGISSACGIALAGKLNGAPYRVYTIVGDGESQEGQVWEACMFAAHYQLDNLCVFIDHNGLQIDGPVCDVMNPMPFDKKLEAFGFHVIVINGHNFDEIESALNTAKTVKGQPTAVIMETVKGKGVSFMENNVKWHGSAPNDEQYAAGLAEIDATLKAIGEGK